MHRLRCRTSRKVETLRWRRPLTKGMRRTWRERTPRRQHEHAPCPKSMWNYRETARKHHKAFSPLDAGGDGDCGCRALAVALKLAAGETPDKAKANAVEHGASFRARAATWIKREGQFRESFAVDDNGHNTWRPDQSTRRTRSGLSHVPDRDAGLTDQGAVHLYLRVPDGG